jgi:peptidoglycan hydrolase-like protein with peptidoglycan-binding domain
MRAYILVFSLLTPVAALAGTFTSLHPEEAYPDETRPLASPGDYADLFKAAQERLRERGFDAGPANGDFGPKTQAALAQFQLAENLPVSGMLDDRTRAELGLN